MERVTILGSGMAGWGAAHRLNEEGVPTVLYDKNSYYGGHTASFKHPDGFIFDEGPHVSFTKHERLQKLYADSVEQRIRGHSCASQQLLERVLDQASRYLQSSRIAGGTGGKLPQGFYWRTQRPGK